VVLQVLDFVSKTETLFSACGIEKGHGGPFSTSCKGPDWKHEGHSSSWTPN
jgi:hypothetical protein